jgi:hypothetical protein
MQKEEFAKLQEGDIITNLGSGNAYIITDRTSFGLVAVRTIMVTNPDEWKRILSCGKIKDISTKGLNKLKD